MVEFKLISEGWRSGLFKVCKQMSEPKFVREFSNQIELNLANWNDGKQIIKIKLMQLELEGKGQRASYKLGAGQRPYRNVS